MSKLARKPIPIPAGVTAALDGSFVRVAGPKGTITLPILTHVGVAVGAADVKLKSTGVGVQARANLGTMASLLKNAFAGVAQGFTKTLEIEGIGFKAALEGDKLTLNVGLTHPVKFSPPAGVAVSVVKNLIQVTGADKAAVGQAAAAIRSIKKPEPYKGKGIHYLGEVIRRKAGKKVAGVGTETK